MINTIIKIIKTIPTKKPTLRVSMARSDQTITSLKMLLTPKRKMIMIVIIEQKIQR